MYPLSSSLSRPHLTDANEPPLISSARGEHRIDDLDFINLTSTTHEQQMFSHASKIVIASATSSASATLAENTQYKRENISNNTGHPSLGPRTTKKAGPSRIVCQILFRHDNDTDSCRMSMP